MEGLVLGFAWPPEVLGAFLVGFHWYRMMPDTISAKRIALIYAALCIFLIVVWLIPGGGAARSRAFKAIDLNQILFALLLFMPAPLGMFLGWFAAKKSKMPRS
jgi:hypothetical protein